MHIILQFDIFRLFKLNKKFINRNLIRNFNKKTRRPVEGYSDNFPDKKILQRVNPSFLGSKWESEYIVGPFIKEINPKDPWLKTRLGHDDVYKKIPFKDEEKLIKLILIDHVPGVGVKGNIIDVNEKLALTNLIPLQKAVFFTSENLTLYKFIIESGSQEGPSSALSPITVSKLKEKIFLLSMSGNVKWTLTKNHVKINLRKQNLKIDEDAIEIPKSPIIGPDKKKEGKDLIIYITINNNNYEKIPVRFMLHHLDEKLDLFWYNIRPRFILLENQKELFSSIPEPPIINVENIFNYLNN